MIVSINLVNWRSHDNTELHFKKGTNLLLGIMGAGKSSVLEAISYALFGTFPALEKRRLKTENIIREGCESSKVVLEFHKDFTYRVVREISKKRSKAELYKDGKLIESGQIPVTKTIEQILEVDYSLFTRAIYSDQNNIDYFLNLDPRKRKKELDSLLGLDRFEEARASIVTVIGRIKSRKEGYENSFDLVRFNELKSQIKQYSEELKSMTNKREELSKEFSTVVDTYSSLKKNLDELIKLKSRFNSLNESLIKKRSLLESLNRDLESYDSSVLDTLKKNLSETESLFESIKKQLSLLEKERLDLERSLSSTREKISQAKRLQEKKTLIETELSKLPVIEESDLKQEEERLISLKSKAESLKRAVHELERLINNVSPDMVNCPLCGKPFDESSGKEFIDNKQKEILSAKQDCATIEKEISVLSKELSKKRALFDKRRNLTTVLSNILVPDTSELSKLLISTNSKLESVDKDILNKKTELENIYKDITDLKLKISRESELYSKAKKRDSLLSEISKIESELASLSFDEKHLDLLREELEKVSAKREQLSESVKFLDSKISTISKFLESSKKDLENFEKLKTRIEKLTSLEAQLHSYRDALLETQTSLRLSLIDKVNKALLDLWRFLYPYGNYPYIRLRVSEKDYVFEVFDGSWKTVESIASGGERAVLALSLRIALAMVLTPKLSWLILDEPTHNLDSNAVSTLANALAVKVPEIVDQIFLITHDEKFIGSDFSISYRLYRNKDSREPTKVELL